MRLIRPSFWLCTYLWQSVDRLLWSMICMHRLLQIFKEWTYRHHVGCCSFETSQLMHLQGQSWRRIESVRKMRGLFLHPLRRWRRRILPFPQPSFSYYYRPPYMCHDQKLWAENGQIYWHTGCCCWLYLYESMVLYCKPDLRQQDRTLVDLLCQMQDDKILGFFLKRSDDDIFFCPANLKSLENHRRIL